MSAKQGFTSDLPLPLLCVVFKHLQVIFLMNLLWNTYLNTFFVFNNYDLKCNAMEVAGLSWSGVLSTGRRGQRSFKLLINLLVNRRKKMTTFVNNLSHSAKRKHLIFTGFRLAEGDICFSPFYTSCKLNIFGALECWSDKSNNLRTSAGTCGHF